MANPPRQQVAPRARRRRRRRVAAIIILIPVVFVALVLGWLARHRGHNLNGTAQAPGDRSSIRGWLTNAIPAAWSADGDRIFINRLEPDGLWQGYSVQPSGRDLRCVTCRVPTFPRVGARTDRGISDVSPDGRYVLVTVEDGAHPGTVGTTFAQPGKGLYNDVWLETVDGRHAWRLTDIPVAQHSAVIFPRFDRTGSEIVWSQKTQNVSFSHPLGQWAMKLARLVWRNGVPHLHDIRTWDPERGLFIEPYEFSPGDRRVLFASDIHVPSDLLSPSAYNSQIWTLDVTHLDGLQRISPPERLHGSFSDYNEFAYYIPGTDRILFGRTYQAGLGIDYWTVSDTGTDPQRVTYMNQRGNPEYLGYSQGGGVAFDPRDPRQFVASVKHRLFKNDFQAVFVTIGASLG